QAMWLFCTMFKTSESTFTRGILLASHSWRFLLRYFLILDYCTDVQGRVTHLFFANPKSIELLGLYSEVLLLDCTYKTNQFKMPLLNIIRTTCLKTIFYIAFCSMPALRDS